METPEITPLAVGASSFIGQVCRDMRIADTVNSIVEWDEDQWKVSPGALISSLVVNILVDRRPLYRVQEFYERMDVPMLFDEPVSSHDLNDDALGRALDRVHSAGGKRVFESVACGVVTRGHLEVRSVHADTTSISLYGEFEHTKSDHEYLRSNPGEKLLEINHGYSKQRRPDLHQFVYGLVTSAEGVPLLGNVNDGNTSDKTWNQQVIEEIQTSILDPQSVIYVADSALITAENLKAMDKAKMKFISRIPETFSLPDELKEKAWSKGKWQQLGPLAPGKKAAHYATQSFEAELEGRTYRFVVVHSSALDKRKVKSLEKRLERERADLEKEATKLGKRTFNCSEDAEADLADFLRSHESAHHRLEGTVTAKKTVKRPRGRPRKDATYPEETTYHVAVEVLPPDSDTLDELRQRESAFVLITTLDEAHYSDHEILEEYKSQEAVERRFRFLKHPLLVDGIYVQSSRRAEALAYVFLLALLVAAFIEMKVRRRLKETKQQVELEGRRKTDRPTIEAILDLVNTIQVLLVETDNGVTRILPKNTDPRAKRFLELAGYDATIYTTK